MNLRDVCGLPGSCLTAGLPAGWGALVVVLAVVALTLWMRWVLRAAMRDTTPRPSLDELDHHHGLAAWREPGRFGRDGLRAGESLDEGVREGLRDP